MIMLLAQIVLAIVVFVYIGDLQEAVRPAISKLWDQRGQSQDVWDGIQKTVSFDCLKFNCIGSWYSNWTSSNLSCRYLSTYTVHGLLFYPSHMQLPPSLPTCIVNINSSPLTHFHIFHILATMLRFEQSRWMGKPLAAVMLCTECRTMFSQ